MIAILTLMFISDSVYHFQSKSLLIIWIRYLL